MRGKIPKLGLLGVLALSMVGCSAPVPTQSANLNLPTGTGSEEAVAVSLPDSISPSEMVKGEEPDVYQTQQRRPYVRWRRTVYRGTPYYAPYYYYYWYPKPYYKPYYSGPYGYYYTRPGFRYRGIRYRRY